jgi:hypothetical protein
MRLVLTRALVIGACLGALAGAGMIVYSVVLISTTTPSIRTIEMLAGGGVFLTVVIGAIGGIIGLRAGPPEKS